MNAEDQINNTDRLLIEIASLGAFYGLTQPAERIFSHYDPTHAAQIGHAFCAFMDKRFQDAAASLEKCCSQNNADAKEHQADEAKLFLVMTYQKMNTRADRVTQLLNELRRAPQPPIARALKALALS